ncbi:MAG: poly(A) polymerase [Alphaproteobacteria bacterium]|nr:MAG: poly(A) polymerase [Alphaproteobacteria bacterium]
MKKINNFDLVCKNLGIPIVFIRKIEKSLKKFNGKIYIVGGNVRDLILNKSIINHPDLVVNLDLEKLLYCLEKAKIRFLKIGEKFGSIVVLHKKFKFDVTVMRKDIKTDGRWAKIKFTDNLIEDSKRRDFTFNSIYCDTDGHLVDPNNGINDLIKGNVRFIGDPNKRIKEDYLRILRFFRFSLEISNSVDHKISCLCEKYFKNLKSLSYERRMKETEKILLNNNLKKKEIILSLKNLLEFTFESKLNFTNFTELCIFESLINKKSFERRLKFLLRNNKDIPNFFLKSSTTHFKKRLKSQINFKNYSNRELNMNLLKFNKIYITDQLIIDCVKNKISRNYFDKYLMKITNYKTKKIPLTGEDLLKMGFKPGKTIGEILTRLETFWVEKDFKCSKNECKKFVQKFLP